MADDPEVDTRGHITVPLDGVEFTLRPSFEAISQIERLTGKSHERLAHDSIQQNLSYGELALICCEMMKAHAKANPKDPMRSSYSGAKPEKLEKLIYAAGKVRINVRVTVVLTAALSGGYTAEGEVVATETSEAIPAAE